MTESNTRSKWLATPRLILIAAILCLVGLAIAAKPSVRFFKAVFEDAIFPIAEFDANTSTTFTLPDSNTRFVVMLQVENTSDPLPPLQLVLESNGIPIQTTPMNGWKSMMGHSYRYVASFAPPESLECTINITADNAADFGIFYDSTTAYQHRIKTVLPWWIGASALFFTGMALVFFVILRLALQKNELELVEL